MCAHSCSMTSNAKTDATHSLSEIQKTQTRPILRCPFVEPLCRRENSSCRRPARCGCMWYQFRAIFSSTFLGSHATYSRCRRRRPPTCHGSRSRRRRWLANCSSQKPRASGQVPTTTWRGRENKFQAPCWRIILTHRFLLFLQVCNREWKGDLKVWRRSKARRITPW